jgi:hypothetical protein
MEQEGTLPNFLYKINILYQNQNHHREKPVSMNTDAKTLSKILTNPETYKKKDYTL